MVPFSYHFLTTLFDSNFAFSITINVHTVRVLALDFEFDHVTYCN